MRRIYEVERGDIVLINGKQARVTKVVRGFDGDLFFYVENDDSPRYVKAYEFYREEGGSDGEI